MKNGNRGVKQLSAAGSRGSGDVSGRRVSGFVRLGWLEGKKREGAGRSGRFGRNSRNNRRGCALPPPGSGRMPGTGTCRGCGNRAASEPMTCVVCRGSGRAGVGVEEVCCVGVGGGVLGLMGSCRYCGVSDGFDGCGGLQKGLCRRNGDSFRLVHRTDSVPAVRAQKKGTAYTCRYRGPSG